MVYKPPQCSEIEVGGYEDCTWCTGNMQANALWGQQVVPNTRAEYEGLRVDGGDGPAENPGDGSNFFQLVTGLTRRYKLTPKLLQPSWSGLKALLVPGATLGVQGSMGAFPKGHHLRRWQPNFVGAHAMHVVVDEKGLWLQNPLAPNSFPGEYISEANLKAFYEALPNARITYGMVGSVIPPMTGGGVMGVKYTIDERPTETGRPEAGWVQIREGAVAFVLHDGSTIKPGAVNKRYYSRGVAQRFVAQDENVADGHGGEIGAEPAFIHDRDGVWTPDVPAVVTIPLPPDTLPAVTVAKIRLDQLNRDREHLLPDELAEVE